jgi:hypothetical protein
MKRIIYILSLLFLLISVSFAQSVLDYQTGTGLEIQTGADVCADQININGAYSGGGTICGGSAYILNIIGFIQGFYDPATNFMVPDTITVYLRNVFPPFAIVDSAKEVLNLSGAGTFIFPNAVNGVYYYIVLKHRNSIETWSAGGHFFTSGFFSYDFSTANTQAYGNNMIAVDDSPVRYAIFSGDANQDGFVNLNDIIKVYNDGTNFVSGYVVSDMNGDNVVNLTDLLVTYNNSSGFVSVKRP